MSSRSRGRNLLLGLLVALVVVGAVRITVSYFSTATVTVPPGSIRQRVVPGSVRTRTVDGATVTKETLVGGVTETLVGGRVNKKKWLERHGE